MDEKQKKRISKFLGLILRHQPSMIDLTLDNNGWAGVEELLSKAAAHNTIFSKEDLEDIVASNDKQRFIFNEDRTRIRANQGHSIEVELDLQAQQPPAYLYHGTVEKFLEAIRSEGLKKMGRQHVHLSNDKETAQKVGSRHGKPIILHIRGEEMHRDGFVFYISENGVWLTDHVPVKYIEFNTSLV